MNLTIIFKFTVLNLLPLAKPMDTQPRIPTSWGFSHSTRTVHVLLLPWYFIEGFQATITAQCTYNNIIYQLNCDTNAINLQKFTL